MTEEVIRVTGLRETQQALYGYSQQMGDRVVLMALRTGANYMRRVVQANTPVLTGKLRRGFKVSRSRIYNGRRSAETVGVFLTLRKGKDAPFYGRFVNDGWTAGKRQVPGQGFVQKAYEAARQASAELIIRNAKAGAEAVKRRVGLK